MSAPAIREGREDEAPILARAFRQMRLDSAVPEASIEIYEGLGFVPTNELRLPP